MTVNDLRDEFDLALDAAQSGDEPPPGAIVAAIEVHEALRLAWASARAVFGDAARPEHAVAVMEAMLSRYPAWHGQGRDVGA